eukprot:gene41082-35972_t
MAQHAASSCSAQSHPHDPSAHPHTRSPAYVAEHHRRGEGGAGHALGSCGCDCAEQLDAACCAIAERGAGVVVYS